MKNRVPLPVEHVAAIRTHRARERRKSEPLSSTEPLARAGPSSAGGCMTQPPIAVVSRLNVAPSVLRHRFVREARALARFMAVKQGHERVIGTKNDRKSPICQLYGWGRNVQQHVDNTGWIYFVPILGKPSLVCAGGQHVLARNGDVCRLNDFTPHMTYDEGARVCLFIGPYKQANGPTDSAAIVALDNGLQKLASGAHDAPRVSKGFVFPARDEYWALVDDVARVMLAKDAEERGLIVAYCSQCRRRAWKLDHHFPWCTDMNFCEWHMAKPTAEAA